MARFKRQLWEYRYLLLMLLPALTYVIIFAYLPMAGIVVSFKKFNYADGLFASPWNGMANFKFLTISNRLWTLTRNTLLYNFAFIVFEIILEVSFAIIINEIGCKWFKKVFQSFMFFPHFISWVIVVAVMQVLFSYDYGVINHLLTSVGMERINTSINASVWPPLLVMLHLWKAVGYGSIVYLAAVSNIDQSMFEAAEIDGANTWQRIFRVTLPNLIPTIIIMGLMAVGRIFRGDFSMFYQLIGSNGILLKKCDILDLFIYRALAGTTNLGMPAAAGLYQSVLCFITIIFVNWMVKRVEPDYVLF